MRPTVRHLQIFRLFSRVLNVSETARILRVTQPSVSQALRDFEAQMGVSLLTRAKTGLKLTPEAEALLPEVDAVLDSLDRLGDRAARLQGRQQSQLSVATVLPLTSVVIPQALARMRATAPETRFAVETHTSREVIARVQNRAVDLGLTFLPVEAPDLIQHPLMVTDMACLLPAGHPLVARDEITTEDLTDEVVIHLGAQVRQEFDVRMAFDRPADDPRFLSTNGATVSADMVRAGLGVALVLPFVVQHLPKTEVVMRPFVPRISRTLVAIFPPEPGLTPLRRQFLSQIHAELKLVQARLQALGIRARVPPMAAAGRRAVVLTARGEG